MRVLNFHLWWDALTSTSISFLAAKRLKSPTAFAMFFALLLLPSATLFANNPDTACDNVTAGGSIAGDEFGCPSPIWDPSLITSVALPTGGSGNLEYIWMFTTGDPSIPISQWSPIPGSNGPTYDPGPITVTTYYRRCSRRAGCSEYVGETNIVTKEALCCDNVTAGGTIAASQVACQSPYDPAMLTNVTLPSGGSDLLEYQWVMSATGTAYTASNPDWLVIAGATGESFDPVSVSQTTYFIRLSRRRGCSDYAGVSNMVTVAVSDDLAATATTVPVTCFGGNNGSIDLTPTGGTAPYTYAWSGSAGNSQDPANLTAGTYTVTVTDVNGCTTTASASLQNGAQLSVNLTATNETCNGADNGIVAVLGVSGGTGPFNYVWNTVPVHTSALLTNLGPGVYTVTATDVNGCTASASSTVAAGPDIEITLTAADVTCFGDNDGAAGIFSVVNGSGVYTYLWNNPGASTSSSVSNLTAGTYTVTASDNQGCTGTAAAVIADGPQIFPNASTADATCNYSTDGSIMLNVAGGVAPFTYSWDDPNSQTGATANNLAAGTYSVTITDANGCTVVETETVEAPIPATITISGTNISCFNGNNGTATITVTNGGTSTYNYSWNNPGASTTATATGLTAGNYTVTVTDNDGCLVTESITLTQPTALVISATADNATCGNGSDGSITVAASGGTPFGNGSYNYQWSALNSPNVNVLDDVSPGTYTLTVTDANGCTAVTSATISAPPVVTATATTTHVSCNGLANGQISVTAGGGVSPFTYAWSTSGTGTSISNLTPGNYSVVVTDAVGCSAFASATVNEPAVLSASTLKFDVICIPDTDGSAIVLPTGGTAPYNYAWSGGQTTANISNLGTGTYNVTVTDANGCSVSSQAQVFSTTTLAVTTTKLDADCFASNDGAATAVVTGGSSPFNYVWSNGVTAPLNQNLVAGTYGVTVTDADGCIVNGSATVNSPALFTAPTSVASAISNYGGNNGSVTVVPAGGVAPYEVFRANGSTATTLTGLSAGVYSVTATDANGCTAASVINLVDPAKIGNFVWHDLDQDGVQDPNEPGLDGVKIRLVGATFPGVQVNLTTFSDANGFYTFDGLGGGNYRIKCEPPSIHVFSPANVGNDNTDSDINPADSTSAGFTLANGNYESRWDIGLIELDEKVNIGDYVWLDIDKDGIQDVQEQGLANYTVRLYAMPANTLVATKVTNATGKYLFTDVLPGLYQVEFLVGNLPNGHLYSPQNQGTDDNLDSDANPITGRTATFQVFPFTVDNLTIDAGVFKECDNVVDGGLIGQNEQLCGIGVDPAEIVNLSLPTGGFGTLEYLWLQSTVPVYNGPGDPNWSPIPNSNSANYNPGPINQTTYYIRCARRAGCPDYPGETNIVTKSLTPNPLAQIIDHPQNICNNVGDRFEAAIAGGGAVYFWEFGEAAVPATANSRVVDPVFWTTSGLKTVKLTVTRFGCSVTVTTTVNVNFCGDPLIGIFDDVIAVLEGEVVNLKWNMTSDETNGNLFFVQRSENGVDFENLGAVAGDAHDASGMFHFVDDELRLGDNIYRILCRQTNGNAPDGFSQAVTVFYKPEGVLPIQVYPNPTAGNATIEFVKRSPKPTSIEVWNSYGHLLTRFEVPELTEKTELDMAPYPTGVYWVRMQSENVREQIVKLVKAE
ncbi:MAG: T9SS type A sorting domain-containing protein [Saprospiraceae bacterium]|nr:T9SS type A sorting domain-containing protein [Saprospiraceae bacterium]